MHLSHHAISYKSDFPTQKNLQQYSERRVTCTK